MDDRTWTTVGQSSALMLPALACENGPIIKGVVDDEYSTIVNPQRLDTWRVVDFNVYAFNIVKVR